MLERSHAAKHAAPIFFHNYNDFDVYVEDTAIGYAKIFANLLSRAIDKNVTLERVFPLGGRLEVISEARKTISKAPPRKSIFIVDGDLFLLTGEIEQLPPNVITLPRYCIENFLFDEEALISIIDEETHDISNAEIKQRLDYSGWLSRSLEPLKSLFTIYAICQKLDSGIKTVSCGHSKICLNNDGDIDHEKVKNAIDEIKETLVEIFGIEKFQETEKSIIEKIDYGLCFISTYVSAKDYSLPLLLIRLRKISGTKSSNINLKLRFSKKCDISPLKEVGKKASEILHIH